MMCRHLRLPLALALSLLVVTLARGIPSYTMHNVRSEFATIFTF